MTALVMSVLVMTVAVFVHVTVAGIALADGVRMVWVRTLGMTDVLVLMWVLRVPMVEAVLVRGLVIVPNVTTAAPPPLRVRMPTTERVGENVEEHVTKHRSGGKAQERRLLHPCTSGRVRRWSRNERQDKDRGDRDERSRTDRRGTHPPD
mmetsp:Transcript_21637/g.69877  ORF Transcript_21637/g.69877 Transcript_21637/m.69877 type:complete len:150 (-) Transcript_21637:213-662(-)|eukprot:scaffold7977_cov128-Isochrysis_galbana.AAC.3